MRSWSPRDNRGTVGLSMVNGVLTPATDTANRN
jgi:hypothetical protein